MAKYRLTNRAVNDLADIWNYTCNEWSEQQADDYYAMLIAACQKLAQQPELFGRKYEEIAVGLRGFKAHRHIIFYRITKNYVEIVRILHGSMDLENRVRD